MQGHCALDWQRLDERERLAQEEKGVCSALFDVYYGKSPVSPAVKEGAATQVCEPQAVRVS